MKKLLLILPLLALHQSFAEEEICLQVIQPAVSPDGQCQEFSTPCAVPEDWKSIGSCDLVAPQKTLPSMEQKMSGRLYGQNRARVNNRKTRTEKVEAGRNKRPGRGSWTRSTKINDRLDKNAAESYFSRKTRTSRNYSKRSRDWAKYYNQSKGGYQHIGDVTQEERKRRRAYRAPIMSGTMAKRDGFLKNTVNFTTLRKDHTRGKKWNSSFWENRRAKTARKKRTPKGKVYEGPKLRKTYKGSRLEGDLSQ